MKKRFDYNKQIVEIIVDMVMAFPDMRYNQLMELFLVTGEFYEESEITLEHIKNSPYYVELNVKRGTIK